MARLILIAALIFSGSIQALISAPLNWWALSPIYFVPGLWAISRLRGKWALLGGWLTGFAANATIFYWIVHTVQEFSNLPTPVAIVVLFAFAAAFGAYTGLFAWGFAAVRRRSGDWWPLGLAAWWVACEFLNPQLFPYYQGVVFYQVPAVFLLTTLTGVPGISFQILSWNLLLLKLWEQYRAGLPLWNSEIKKVAVVTAAVTLLGIGVSVLRLHTISSAETAAAPRRIALVQSNLTARDRFVVARQGHTALIDTFVDLSEAALAANPGDDPKIDAIVWAEGDLPGPPTAPINDRLRQFVAERHVEVWTGGQGWERGPDGRPRKLNSAYRLYDNGRVDARYDKNILLPFGEFMPWRETFPILKEIRGVGNYIPGDGSQVYDTPAGKFSFLICYEAIRHRYVRDSVQRGVDLLVNVTYDAWFGATACPSQHLMLAAIQSAQYGVPLVRAATTGISAVVDTRGVITDQTDVFVRDTLVADVPRVRLPTLYAAVGDWFAWSCVGASLWLLGGGIRSLRQDRRERYSAQRGDALSATAAASETASASGDAPDSGGDECDEP